MCLNRLSMLYYITTPNIIQFGSILYGATFLKRNLSNIILDKLQRIVV